MSNQIKLVFIMCGIIFFSFHFAQAVELLQDEKIIIPDEAAGPIKIDGVLNEKV